MEYRKYGSGIFPELFFYPHKKLQRYRSEQMKILFISLGCDKNLVDSEHMLGLLVKHGYEITDD